MKDYPDIVVTGIGLISPVGTAQEDFFAYLADAELSAEEREKLAGIEPGLLCKYLEITDPKLRIARYMDPVSKNAIIAMGMVAADAAITPEAISEDPFGYGIVIGATRGACVTREGLYDSLASRGGRMVSGTLFSHCGYNMAGAMAAIAYGVKGPNITLSGSDDAGLSLLRRACNLIAGSRAHTVFVGFSECDGTRRRERGLFAETAFFLCLEKKERALARGARIVCEVREQECSRAEPKGAVYGLQSHDQAIADAGAALALPLPGMAEVGLCYSTLLLLGYLSRENGIHDRFGASAFVAGSAGNGAIVRIARPAAAP
jgi:3-oxoacyl-(acyl-carrier-protein) synthase